MVEKRRLERLSRVCVGFWAFEAKSSRLVFCGELFDGLEPFVERRTLAWFGVSGINPGPISGATAKVEASSATAKAEAGLSTTLRFGRDDTFVADAGENEQRQVQKQIPTG
jgi:hypothetical protein